ncbi:hypothetical protein [Chlamydiifrater volucris]|nr:hypothetical protein [Chlamydiifrater volucris]
MTYSRTPIHKVVLVVLGILVAALPLTTAFSFPLPIVLAFIIPPALVSILLAALLCYKKNISAKDVPYSVENTYKLLKEYTVESWEPKYSSLGGANQISLSHKTTNIRLCLHQGHPFDCKQTQSLSAFLFSIIPSMEKEGNCSRTHSCLSAISNPLWEKIRKSPKDRMLPGEYRIILWEPSQGLPPRSSHLIWTVETTLEDLGGFSKDTNEISFLNLFSTFRKSYLELFLLCFEHKIYEIHLPLLGDNIPKPVIIDDKNWELMKVFPLLAAASQVAKNQKEKPLEIHIDSKKKTPLKGLLLTL